MPTYGYQCTQCKHEFQVFQSMKDDPIAHCPECNGVVKRLLYPVGVVFKGTGWYVNDSRKPEKAAEGNGATTDTTKSDEKSSSDAPKETTPAAASPVKETASS